MPKDKDLQEFVDSMIARLDKMEGTIIGEGRAVRGEIQAVRDEVQLNSLNLGDGYWNKGRRKQKGDHGNGW